MSDVLDLISVKDRVGSWFFDIDYLDCINCSLCLNYVAFMDHIIDDILASVASESPSFFWGFAFFLIVLCFVYKDHEWSWLDALFNNYPIFLFQE